MQNDGWIRRRLGEFCTEQSRRAGNANLPVLSVSKDRGIILQSEKFKKRVASENTSRYKRIQRGEFAYDPMLLWSGSIARQARVPEGLISPAYYAFSVDHSVDGDFLGYFLKQPGITEAYAKISFGTNTRRQKAQFADFANLEFWFPPLPEQRKIAAILSSVDEAIRSTKALKEQINVVKQEVLQDLLTKGISHRSFQKTDIGEIPEGWSCVTLAEVVDPKRKITYGIVQPGEYTPGGIPLIRGQDYIGGWTDLSSMFHVAPELHATYRRSTTRPGDLLLCIVGATTGAVNQVPHWIEEANITQTTARIACQESLVLPRFLLHYLSSPLGKAQVRRYVKGSAQPGLNLADVAKFKLGIPPVPEQEEIVRVIDLLDETLISQGRNYESLNQIKHGLMQDLLTGRVRVPVD